jgi:GT2 family glycosyltransferase
MSTPDTITVVVPCYNAAAWIGATLRSVVAQDWPEIELLVVDDGSTDASVAIVKREFPRARVLTRSNAGAAAARNLGMQAAQGRWVAFIDADDYWLHGKLRAQMELLAADPEAGMACTSWHLWPCADPDPSPALLEALQQQADDLRRWDGPSGWIYPELLLGCQVWTSTVLMRTELLRELGGFDTSLRIGEDYDLWLRASRLTPILRVKRPLALYRQHPASLTHQPPDRNHEAAVVEQALARWRYASPDGRSADPREVARSLARTWCGFAAANLAAGRADAARSGVRKALAVDWRNAEAWKLGLKTLAPSLWRSQATDGRG